MKSQVTERTRRRVPINQIVRAVAKATDVPVSDIMSRRRTASMAEARQLVCFIARVTSDYSLPEIAGELGRDHTTVLYAIDKVAKCEHMRAFAVRIAQKLAEAA